MEWTIAPHTRADIHAFSGINFSGERRAASIHPAGGLQGDKFKDFAFRSVAIVAPPGTFVVLATSVLPEGWDERPWRALQVLRSDAYRTKDGKLAVRIPDLDWYDKGTAHRTDPDFQQTFPQVLTFAEGTGWTFGRSGTMPLKDNIKAIHIIKR